MKPISDNPNTPTPAEAGQTANGWRPIATAPKYEWFLALAATERATPRDCRVAVIHRVDGVGFGPWEGSEEAYYKADYFTHWMPLPSPDLQPPLAAPQATEAAGVKPSVGTPGAAIDSQGGDEKMPINTVLPDPMTGLKGAPKESDPRGRAEVTEADLDCAQNVAYYKQCGPQIENCPRVDTFNVDAAGEIIATHRRAAEQAAVGRALDRTLSDYSTP